MDMEQKTHSKECACGHEHHYRSVSFTVRWLMSMFIVSGLLFLLRPFLVQQMFVRVSSYLTCASYNDAIRVCKKIIFVDKNNLRVWSSLGYAYKENGQIDKVISSYEKVFLLNPTHKGACFDLGMAYFSKQEFAKALSYFKRIRNEGPDKGKSLAVDFLNYHRCALTMLGECYKQLGDIAKVREIEQEIKRYYPKASQGWEKINLYEKQKTK